MSNGSGAAVRPGHTMPVGADPDSEDGFTQWVNSIHPSFEASALGKRLIAEGFDSVHDAHLVTIAILRTDFELKSGHAAKFVEAAHAVQASISAASVMGEVVSQPVWPLQFAHQPKRTLAPPVPVASGTVQGCGVGGLASAAAMTAWVTRLVSWARANWGQEAAGAVELIARDTGTSLSIPQQAVSEEFELALHAALVGGLPDITIRFLGEAASSSSGLEVLQMLLHPVLGSQGHSATQQALQQFEQYPAATSRGQLLEWLHGFDNHCSLLAQVGEPVSTARKIQKIESCCRGIAGFAQELKSARAGAAGANQQLDFMELFRSIAVDGAQERTKQGPVKKALSAAKATEAEVRDQRAQQMYMLDDEAGVMRPVTMANMVTPKQGGGGKRGKGGKSGKAKKPQTSPAATVAQQPQSATDAPKGICRAFYVDGHCPRWEEHGFCPFQHFGPDQIVMSTNGYWKPKQGAKPGLAGSALQGFHAEHRDDPEGEDPDWAWENGSVGSQHSARSARSARSAASQRSALATVVSLLQGVFAMMPRPTAMNLPARIACMSHTMTPDPSMSESSAGGLTSDSEPYQRSSGSEAAEHEVSKRIQAHSRGHIGHEHPDNPFTMLTTHKGGGTTGTVERPEGHTVILDIGATDDLIGSDKATLADRVTTLARPIQLFTAGGVKAVRRVGDLTLKGALGFTRAMLAPWSSLTLVSLPTRLSQGWTWSAAGREACLVSPEGEPHRFSLKEGLFRYCPLAPQPTANLAKGARTRRSVASDPKGHGGTDNDVSPTAEATEDDAKSAKQGVKQTPKGGRALTSKALTLLLTRLLTTWVCGTPTMDPQLQLLTQELGQSVLTPARTHGARKATVPVTLVPHGVRGHMPHDPDCLPCKMSRLTKAPATRNAPDSVIEGSDKGFVVGIDLYGPFTPDVDGHTYAMIGVEVGHTDYGMVRLLPDRTAAGCAKAMASMRNELKIMSSHPTRDLVRVHSDDDTSFKGEMTTYFDDHMIRHTTTGGYRPTNNSRTERRIRMINEAFRANLIVATGGLTEYESLWGPGLMHAMHCSNANVWSDGRCPYKAITGKDYDWGKHDLCFGQSGLSFKPTEHRYSKFQPTGECMVWVGHSFGTPDAARVVPVIWDGSVSAFTLGQVKEVVRFDPIKPTSFILKEGPSAEKGNKTVKQFLTKYNLPSYKCGGVGTTDEQIDGCDPILEVESIQGKKNRGNKTRYLVKWKGHVEMTWEPKSHLKDCKDIVRAFEDKANKAKTKLKQTTATSCEVVTGETQGGHSPVMMTIDPRAYIIDNDFECVIPRHHWSVTDEPWAFASDTTVAPSSVESEAVSQLLTQQKRQGTVNDWLPGYRAELGEVTRRRLRPLSTEEVDRVGAVGKAVRLRMNLEPKRDGRRKCRLILQGFREPKSWDRGTIDSPVAALSTIRAMVFMVGNEGDIISSIDVSTAFLQSESYDPSDEPRYVSYQPCKSVPIQYYQLLGPLYGQRSASMRWYSTLKQWLISQGFVPGLNEPCVFTHANGLRVAVWVDDIIVRGSKQMTEQFYDRLGQRFDIKDPSYLTPHSPLCFVGLDIEEQDTTQGPMRVVNQNNVMSEYLNSLDITPNPTIQCPMPEAKVLWSDSAPLNEADASWYRSQIGSLNYFAMTTRYDIAHAVSRLSQCAANPTRGSHTALVRVLKYLVNNPTHNLIGKRSYKDKLSIYSDSDHAGDRPHTMKSHTGCLITLNDAPIQWLSKKQIDSTAYSSAMAEIYALSECVRVARSVAWRCEEMGMKFQYPLCVQVDNRQAKTFQAGTCINSKIRGVVDMREKWVQELRDLKSVMVKWVPAHLNKADIMTKCFPNWIYQNRKKLITG